MSNSRMLNFRSFLTEQFTTFAVEVFNEVESIVEAYQDENKRLKTLLHMVLSPNITLSKIDINHHHESTPDFCEPLEDVDPSGSEISDHLPAEPKEESIELEIGCELNQEEWPEETDMIKVEVCVKDDPDAEETSVSYIAESQHVPQNGSGSSKTASIDNMEDEHSYSLSLDLDEEASVSPSSECNESMIFQDIHETSNANVTAMADDSLQKTLLQIPRKIIHDFGNDGQAGQQTFMQRLCEAYENFPEEEKPLITKMGLATDKEWRKFSGELPSESSVLSSEVLTPYSKVFKPYDDAPPPPPLPLVHHCLESGFTHPTLDDEEQIYVDVMQISWEQARAQERSSRGCKKSAKKLQKMRLSSHFRDICKLKPGKSHAEHLLKSIRGHARYETTHNDENRKLEAIQDYCRNLCLNWSPCGMVVHPDAPWLASMPDGLVYDPKEQRSYGLLHVKSTHFQSVMECSYLLCWRGGLRVKKSHQCYWQIQGEMMVTGTSWCDVLVYSREDMLVQRLYRDEIIIQMMHKRLEEFFFTHYLPSLTLKDHPLLCK